MKQVLTTLVKFLSQDTKRVQDIGNESSSSLAEEAAVKCLNFICGDGDLSCIKPSMMMLDTLLSKRKIQIDFLLSLYSTISPGNGVLKQDQALSFELQARTFVQSVLCWAHHVDISLAVGKLLATFLSSIYTMDRDGRPKSLEHDDKPLWTEVLLDFALEKDNMTGITEAYVLPSLLRTDSANAMKFLKSLPLTEIIQGRVGTLTDKHVCFCLVTAKMADDDSLETATGEMKNLLTFCLRAYMALVDNLVPLPALSELSVRERIAAACLYHQDAEIRNAATFLLVQSKQTLNPFPTEVLNMLRKSLPHSYVEVDAKARGDFLSTLSRLCSRLQHAITKLRRSTASTNATSEFSRLNENLANHVNFCEWLFRFSCSQLQPTASYQRHITGLKTLHLMLKSEFFAASKVIPHLYICMLC